MATVATAATATAPMQLFVSDASGVLEEMQVAPDAPHTAFVAALREKFGKCVPVCRPLMASVVRNDELVRDACFRVGKVGDSNTVAGLGIQAGDLLWFSFEAEARALPPEWVAHPKDLIPLVETHGAARERERTARLRELERQLAALHTEHRLCLKKEDFVRTKELAPLIAVAQKKIDDFLARSAATSPTNRRNKKQSGRGSPAAAGGRGSASPSPAGSPTARRGR